MDGGVATGGGGFYPNAMAGGRFCPGRRNRNSGGRCPGHGGDGIGSSTNCAGVPRTASTARSGLPAGLAPAGALLGRWPLLAVLAVQAVLSLRLVRADTAFQDEAAYLWAGHLQWAHWLHGTPLPPFPAYFSGAPVIYPPLAAVADSLGGLAAARILSLAFMLGATVLLWAVAGRLFGRRAAFFATALFAVLGPTLHLGTLPPTTPWRCSWWRWRHGAWCAPYDEERRPAGWWRRARRSRWLMPRRIRRLCSTRS